MLVGTFYDFSGTNLLTRCHSASSLFSVFFGFRNPTQEIFSELEISKTKSLLIHGTTRKSKQETNLGTRAAAPTLGAAWHLAAPKGGVVLPWPRFLRPS